MDSLYQRFSDKVNGIMKGFIILIALTLLQNNVKIALTSLQNNIKIALTLLQTEVNT